MSIGVMPRATKIALMTLGQAAGGPWELCTLKLFVGDTVPNEASVAADFVEPTFDGYATVVAPAWGAAYQGPDGLTVVTGPDTDYVATGVTVADSVTGWFLVKTAGGALEYAERFDQPKPMGQFIGQGFTFIPRVVYGS